MRRFLLYILIFMTFPLSAENITRVKFESAEYDPETIRTGDNVFCRIKLTDISLSSEDADSIHVQENSGFDITDIKLNFSSNEILIWFIPFNPGEKYLPVIKTGRFTLDKVPVDIKKYLEPGDQFPEPPGAVLLPGTRLILGFMFFLVSLFFFLLYYTIRFYYKPLAGKISEAVNEKEIKKILASIRSMNPENTDNDGVEFCNRINMLFRSYLGKRLTRSFMNMTSGEIIRNLCNSVALNESTADSLEKSLFISDRIRFGKNIPSRHSDLKPVVYGILNSVDAVERESGRREGK